MVAATSWSLSFIVVHAMVADEHIASVVQLPQDGEFWGLAITSTGFNDIMSIGTFNVLATV